MQIKNSFDKETMIKIGKGALIAITGAAGIALFDYLGTIQIDNPLLAAFIAWVVPVAINAIKEWKQGR